MDPEEEKKENEEISIEQVYFVSPEGQNTRVVVNDEPYDENEFIGLATEELFNPDNGDNSIFVDYSRSSSN